MIAVRKKTTLEDVRNAKPKKIYYAVNSCWWTHRAEDLATRTDNGLPCGPRGSVLMETGDVEGFLALAEDNPEHYGKHGSDAFMAAHQDNCVLRGTEKPWSAQGWQAYNDALDRLAEMTANPRHG